jgi:hypothetical protein
MRILLSKLKEVALSVIPIMVIVTILNFTLVPLDLQYIGGSSLGH